MQNSKVSDVSQVSPKRLFPAKRRTFAIISHPDAGKTTLTEKLLLYGGAIQMAGQVKARGDRRRTRSDWLEIERSRGISVSSSVMTFEHNGVIFNLLDTPGHADFSEDTYRTLSAVDAAVMVIDAAKGIESQTRKLFEVCRLRDIPIITFINKVDREGIDPLEMLDEIAAGLALDLSVLTWPIGLGTDFRGCCDIYGSRLLLPKETRIDPFGRVKKFNNLDDLLLNSEIEERIVEPAVEGLLLCLEALPKFHHQAFLEGHLSPVIFGSALKEFGVAELLDCLTRWAPDPLPRKAKERSVDPHEKRVTGFVFKVQANMDPNHRDRVAFVRLCSGRFVRGMKLLNVRDRRSLTVSAPIFFFAQQRETLEEAFAGDIVGIPNHGTLRVGDTLTEGEILTFEGIPDFAPEVLRRIGLGDATRTKQLNRGLNDMAEEGVIQIFRPIFGTWPILGAVGTLQLDVLVSRLNQEYGVPIRLDPAPYETARWIVSTNPQRLREFCESYRSSIAEDKNGGLVFLAKNAWTLNRATDEWPDIEFLRVRERS
ncbi:peptide chain release factor 3 [Nitrobacter winogradskyi]|uniref:Peptide chain release factor 3 n=2 Tax=Nitrobacter winogradskyi TaxID=913 RepID=A0ACC6AKC2_NITWI|nr:peptide chain release factor 3 [Nitrobacter winogradskyi]MCP1999632.1 peptide chain release factor 3 [Nitrobacter winogradskyi]